MSKPYDEDSKHCLGADHIGAHDFSVEQAYKAWRLELADAIESGSFQDSSAKRLVATLRDPKRTTNQYASAINDLLRLIPLGLDGTLGPKGHLLSSISDEYPFEHKLIRSAIQAKRIRHLEELRKVSSNNISVGAQGAFDEMAFPKKPTTASLLILHAEWHWSPVSRRSEDYFVDLYDSYWLLWASCEEGFCNLHGFVPIGNLRKYEAALALMIAVWLFEKDEFGSETAPDITESQFFSHNALQYILDSVWS